MASISSLGVGSGLDLSSIVTGLVNAERAPVENRLSAKEQDLQLELSSFGVLRSSLTVFQERLEGLQSSSTYNAKEISVSDEAIFSASVENSADLGNYTVEVSALATKHSLATNAAAAFNDINDVIGTGTLNIRFGATSTGPYSFTPDLSKATQSITISEANNNNTLSGLRDYINNNDLGIQASIVDDGTGYRMVLTSEKTGANNSMEITVAGDGDGNNNDNSGLSQLAFNASAQSSVIQTVAAQDAALSINGLDITRDSNTVSGAINGVTLNLLRADVGNFVNVDITENRDEIKNTIEGFVKGYNGVVNSINSLTNFDPESGSAGALIGDFTVRSISSQLRNIMYTSVSGLTGNISSLIDIGIKTGLDGKMEIDTSKLDEALTNFPSEVEALFALQGRPTDTNISYSSASEDTIPGEYGINISTIATRAIFNGTAVNSLTIDANNDNFEIVVNGVSSSQISLVQGLYSDGDELAAHIQAQINNDANLKDAGVSVVVDFDGINNEFDIISSEYGSNSSIEITSVDINTANDLGLNAGIGIS
nr:flagellar filament capping protein FliD [Gammaproteobacteria bacterium]